MNSHDDIIDADYEVLGGQPMSNSISISKIENGYLISPAASGFGFSSSTQHYCATTNDVLKYLGTALQDLHNVPRAIDPSSVDSGMKILAKEIGLPEKKVKRAMKKSIEAMDEGEDWKPE